MTRKFLPQPRRMTVAMRRTLLPAALMFSLLLAPAAEAAVGDQLANFRPPRTGDGRAIEIKSGSTAYLSPIATEDVMYVVNLRTQADLGTFDTALDTVEPGRNWGALTGHPDGLMYGASYGGPGKIYRLDPNSGAVTFLFNAATIDAELDGVDGLSAHADGSLFISGDGLGQVSRKIYRVTTAGSVVAGPLTVPFANSGIAVDGEDMWLADIDSQRIHKYTTGGASAGVSFPVADDILPEDLAIDNCSFPGKKALWAYSAGFGGGKVAAYEIGSSTNAGCPPDNQTIPGVPGNISVPGKRGGYRAGLAIFFDARGPADPTGTLFIYVWDFGDWDISLSKPRKRPRKRKPKQDRGGVYHTYKCAGIYKPTVTVIDQNGVRKQIAVSKGVAVDFAKRDTKRHGNLQISPNLAASSKRARIKLDVKKIKKKGRTKIRKITYKVDGRKVGTRKSPKKAVRAKLRRAGPHVLEILTQFKGPRGKKKIKTCFQV